MKFLYIFFVILSLNIFFFSTVKAIGKAFKVENIEIPENGSVSLKPGGLHIMLFDLKSRLKEGESIDLSLHFANGDVMEYTIPVKSVMNGMAMDSDHKH